ncbi:MAG: Two-component transcriptional response regulator, winged helix family [uncultured Chloroflexia bacterium]|uniref:Two-component transcriptional response regulator, winged helix family n=1 Tax=uncultured Chloroflexia bacterium TaxID=1672391 RepID=A0A6J4HTD8_9CHLR|nr:MAG: Two-component transcriptional response regulator, winged helix family [uncultured Chloroflexia bacterium]
MKVLIAEDARDVAEVVAFGVRMTWPGAQVMVAVGGAEALQSFVTEPPDLVILDISIPPPDGFEVCRRIREGSRVPILMLTVRDATLDKVRALDLGADDYLTKPFDHLELLARLRSLMRRANSVSRASVPELTIGDLTLDLTRHAVLIRGEAVHLTSTEYRVLEELVRHAGIVLTHQVLLDRVWGPGYQADAHYLKVFVRRLRQKLGDDAEHPRYIQTEWGIGYRFVPIQ